MSFLTTVTTSGTPVRLTTDNVHCRSFIIEAPTSNSGDVFWASTEAQATTVTRHIMSPGDVQNFNADNYGNLDTQYNLKYFWADAVNSGDRLVVTYLDHIDQEDGRTVSI